MSKARRSTDIVVYLRCRLADRVASDAAMIEQRVMLATWCAAQAEAQSILAEFLEEEGEGVSRPSLVAAIAFCKARKATLVIVSMQPIGTGQPFEPRSQFLLPYLPAWSVPRQAIGNYWPRWPCCR